MTKKELIDALKNVNDNDEILFGNNEESSLGSISSQIYQHWDHMIIITNSFITSKPLNGCKLIFEK